MHLVILGACEVAGGSAPGLALIMSKDLQACEATTREDDRNVELLL